MREFLAAPESVLRSQVERRKLLERKAHEEAERQRILATKRKERPTAEDLLADIVRVAEDESVNPYSKLRIVSSKRYRLCGHYPIEFVFSEFGTFEHAKEVAGLSDRVGTRTKKLARAEQSRREHASRYLQRWVLPFVGKAPRAVGRAGVSTILSISDTHATFLDPFTWHCFLSAIRDLQPAIVYLNGDILEGSEISRFPKIPGWTVPLQLELDFAREMFRQVREVTKSAEVWWGAGNHGIDRLVSYLTQSAPAFAGLRSMRFDELADLRGLDVRLAQGGTILSPVGTEGDRPGTIFFGCYWIHHGTRLGAHAGDLELKSAGMSGQSGHVHRASLAYAGNASERMRSWMTTPMGCTHRAGRAYMRGTHTGWQQGFGVAFVHRDGHVRQYPVCTDDGIAIVEGRVYRRPGALREPDPQTLWLKSVPVPR